MMILLVWSLSENEGLTHLGNVILREVNSYKVEEILSYSSYWLIVIFYSSFIFPQDNCVDNLSA